MMALNIAVPLTAVGDLMDGFGLLSPISPLSVDCRAVTVVGSHGKKQLISPVGSESSGVSSLDSEEIKKPTPPGTPTEEVAISTIDSTQPPTDDGKPEVAEAEIECPSKPSAKCPSSTASSMRSSLSSTDSISDDLVPTIIEASIVEPVVPKQEPKIVLGGRNVLDLMDNLTTPGHFRLQFAQLPENDNIHFFLDNRSQYHRLGANGHIQEYTMVKCKCCDFSYPVNGTSQASGTSAIGAGTTITSQSQSSSLSSVAFQQHQQQQQFQWNSIANSYNSIANSRDKMSVNVAGNAFNKTFTTGTGNSGNSNNNGGNQYFRNGNIAAGLFGRDSNRSNGGNFLNSTTTYNNHKSYQQQSFGVPNNTGNKFNNQYGQLQQQQQPFYSKNHSLRFGTGGNNGAGGGSQSASSSTSGYNSSAAIAAVTAAANNNNNNMFAAVAAAALASQNLLNSNGFNNSNNSYNNNNNKSNNNNMFAYYKTIM